MDISVIITAYNKGIYIRQCLEGVLNQDFHGDFEIILADDCSTDNTYEVVHLLTEHPNFRKVKYTKHSRNKGLMGNFIWALNQAVGEYVCFCDGDDVWISNQKISNQISFLRSNPEYGGCGMLMDIVDTRNEYSRIQYSDLHFPYNKNTIVRDDEVLDFKRFPFGTSTFMFKRRLLALSDIGKFNFVKVSNDYVLFVLIHQKSKLFYLNELSVRRNHNDGGVTAQDQNIQLFLMINNFLMFKRLRQMLEIIQPCESSVILNNRIEHLRGLIIRKYVNRSLGEFFKNFSYYLQFKNSSRLFVYLLAFLPDVLIRKFKLKLY
jgi:glycosyltransferase involved in cell wall biosynthesis